MENRLKMPRVLISALSGGGGKTLLSLGIARAFLNKSFNILPFKKGADYIDTSWLALAAKRKAYNLDPFFLDKEALRNHFSAQVYDVTKPALALIEGNRGLYDGKDKEGSASSAEVALNLQCPVILSIDCTKMTRTAAALVQGMINFQPEVPIKGVVLNNLASSRHENIIRDSIEKYCTVPVLGAIPRFKKNPLPERHHGLILNVANSENEVVLDNLADICERYVDLDLLLAIAENAPDFQYKHIQQEVKTKEVRIGYVEDKALWFYYEENLEALKNAGAELVPLSLFDIADWDSIHGLYIGGGYPELYCEEIVASGILKYIKAMSEKDLPIYAECGGFMLLVDNFIKDENTYSMAGIFPVTLEFHKRPQGLGYIEGHFCGENNFFSQGAKLLGHEFHYSTCKEVPKNTLLSLSKGMGMGNGHDALEKNKTFAMYTHIYAPASPEWANQFVNLAKIYKEGV